MLSHVFMAALNTRHDASDEWSAGVAAVITISCLLCLLILPRLIEEPQVGKKMPLGPLSSLFNNPSIGTFIACMAAGHLFGVPAVFGLRNLGIF